MTKQTIYKQRSDAPPQAREKVLETPVVNIYSGPVQCKRNGVEKTFYFLDFPDWVNVIALTPDLEIILVRQFRFGTGKDELEIPGGVIETGEDPVTAGCRELLEECGYSGHNARIIGQVCPNPAIQKNLCYTVLVEEAIRTAAPKLDEMEDIEVILRPRNVLMDAFIKNTLNIGHGLVLNAFSHYRHLIEQSR